MIHVDRSNIPRPDWWHGRQFREFLDRWREFHGEGGSRVLQKRMDPRKSAGALETWKRRALPDLLAGFHGKCAYSEEPIDDKSGTVIFHRPESDAVGLEGEVSPEHYWWLVEEWTNWLPVEQRVAHLKGQSFPVVGPRLDPRGEMGSSWPAADSEAALLLDPGQDHPAWYLRFQWDGSVVAREHPRPVLRERFGIYSRGEATIRILGLNEGRLKIRRKTLQRPFAMEGLLFEDPEGLAINFERDFGRAVAAAGYGRQELARRLLRFLSQESFDLFYSKDFTSVTALLADEIAADIAHGNAPPVPEGTVRLFLEPILPIFEREWPELSRADVFALATGADREVAFLSGGDPPLTASVESHVTSQNTVERTAWVEHLSIRNFKAIKDLGLELSTEPIALPIPFDPTTWNQPEIEETAIQATRWTAFLGENGSGKSCCLEAIALALAADRLDDLIASAKLDWSKLLRRGTDDGHVHLRFTDGAEIRLQFDETGHRWLDDEDGELLAPPKMAAYVRGYGATRLLEGGPVEGVDEHVRLANLFDPRAPVLDAKRWLLDLPEKTSTPSPSP